MSFNQLVMLVLVSNFLDCALGIDFDNELENGIR